MVVQFLQQMHACFSNGAEGLFKIAEAQREARDFYIQASRSVGSLKASSTTGKWAIS